MDFRRGLRGYGLHHLALMLVAAFVIFVFNQESASAQSVGDTVTVEAENVLETPTLDGERIGFVEDGTRGVVTAHGPDEEFYRIEFDDVEGWVYDESVTDPELNRLMKEARSRGYTILIVSQQFEKSELGTIDTGLGIFNISDERTIKYMTATWQLYNPVGDPVESGLESSTAETRFVGPVEPGTSGFSTFEDVWSSEVGSCVVLKKLVVEHIDGGTFTYIDDLQDIVTPGSEVRLEGDCSYEAQKSRE